MRSRGRSRDVRVKYAFIKAHRSEFDTAPMCRVLGVSRSGFYDWLRKPLSDRVLEERRLLGLIRASYEASHGIYAVAPLRGGPSQAVVRMDFDTPVGASFLA